MIRLLQMKSADTAHVGIFGVGLALGQGLEWGYKCTCVVLCPALHVPRHGQLGKRLRSVQESEAKIVEQYEWTVQRFWCSCGTVILEWWGLESISGGSFVGASLSGLRDGGEQLPWCRSRDGAAQYKSWRQLAASQSKWSLKVGGPPPRSPQQYILE